MSIGDDLSTKSQITVKKLELLDKLRANRASHRKVFLKAQEGYRDAVIKELDRMLKDARDNKRLRVDVCLPAPQDHTPDYDRIILMLEMSVVETIVISERQFQQYVMDDWAWKGQFIDSVSSYTVSE
jgi:hypothetical protein